ncbi:hypothetical protein DPMN_167555 [Dreissena polymorpha]|uniref:Uncharacterized protein n=1 Tax=Dreissena polymorpha TaxID=45954 RepID=A0A9D4F4Q8_DREPO|nr:hypothetical protein DPMN_167555 [Dreissena polymorpha]
MCKAYSEKRPEQFSNDDDPFYLAPRSKGCSSQWFLRPRLGEVKLRRKSKPWQMHKIFLMENATQTTLHENILSRSCEAMILLPQKLWLLLVLS